MDREVQKRQIADILRPVHPRVADALERHRDEHGEPLLTVSLGNLARWAGEEADLTGAHLRALFEALERVAREEGDFGKVVVATGFLEMIEGVQEPRRRTLVAMMGKECRRIYDDIVSFIPSSGPGSQRRTKRPRRGGP